MVIEKKRRKFSFKESDYNLPFKGKQRQEAKNIIRTAIRSKRDVRPVEVLAKLKAKKLGYRKKNFLADYAKAQATEHSSTHTKYIKANRFWEGVVRIKKRDKLKTYSEASKKLRAYKEDLKWTYTDEQLKELEDLSFDGENIFSEGT